MDAFEIAYLLCRSDSSTSILSPLHELAFVAGPGPVHETMSSLDVQEVPEYKVEAVRNAFLALPGMTEVTIDDRPGLSMFEWRESSRTILTEVEPPDNPDWPFWSGSSIEAHCTFSDVLEIWIGLALQLPQVWLHNSNCTMFSPESFVEHLALPALHSALQSDDRVTRNRAEEERKRYEPWSRVIEPSGDPARGGAVQEVGAFQTASLPGWR